MTGTAKGRCKGRRCVVTQSLHQALYDEFDRLYAEECRLDECRARHLSKSYFAEKIQQNPRFPYSIFHINKLIRNRYKNA